MLVPRVVCLLALVPCLVWAQLAGDEQAVDNTAGDNCECSPECEGGVSSGTCKGRLVTRDDCPCCKVCARQEGEACSLPTQPCDTEFGLVCSPEGVCKAEISCSKDADCPAERFCLGEVCADPCPILTPCLGNLKGGQCVVREHRPLCECPPGTLKNSEASACIPLHDTQNDPVTEPEEATTVNPVEAGDAPQEPVTTVEVEAVTTLAPPSTQPDTEDQPAVVVEYDDAGEQIHRITVQEQVHVVTEAGQTLTYPSTDPTPTPQNDLTLAREGKKVPDDDNSTREDQPATEPSKVEGKAGVGALKVRQVNHNSSTITLPSSKGGELYYKGVDGSEWLQEAVDAGRDSVVLRGLQPNTQYTLKWTGAFGGSAKITLDTEEGCRAENVSYGVGEEWLVGCEKRCSCMPGAKVDCQDRCRFKAGDVQDPKCRESPAPQDPECCVVYDCTAGEGSDTLPSDQDSVGQPKLLVTAKTHSSVTLAWDDFRARTYEGGYVAEYREEDERSAVSKKPWKRKEVPTGEQPPKLTVEGLKPNTLYEVRVSIYDDVEEDRLGEATETINFRTEAGCLHGNSSHAVGEFFNGCEERCICLATGAVRCFERCTLPFIRAGSFKGDPYCSEQPDESDECCATVQCASNRRAYSPCTNVVCGPNAECISSATSTKELSLGDINSDLTPGYCRCNKGFTGDASDLVTGCVSDPTARQQEGSCTFKNSTYRPGDVFYDKCDYRCTCNNNTEIECEPRCEFPHEDGSESEPGCEYLPDPSDACCKLRVCNSTSAAATDAARAPSLPSDGCTQGNITYARNEKFYNGCETQCICMGFGDVSCFPRCPPLKVMSDRPTRCETLPDPLDSCCSITVCDSEMPDVMKANITELQDKIMKNMTETEKEMLKKEMVNMTDAEKEMMMKEMISIARAQESAMMNVTMMEEPSNQTDNLEHTQEDGTTHSHPHDGPHTHDNEDPHFHTHEDGTSHSHPHDGPHTHNSTSDLHMHTHEDGTTHSHPHGGFHTHNDSDDPHLHTHADGTTHSHPHDGPHTHDNDDPHFHTHEDGTAHSHPHDSPHTHDDDDPHMDTNENSTIHSHPHDGFHTHNDTDDPHLHTHADGTTHSHPHDGPHTHDTNDPHFHMHEDGTAHSHPHDGFHTHNDTDDPHLHTHEDGTTHSHPHDGPHTHDSNDPHFHIHEDGTAHSHPHDGLHIHDNDDPHNHTHEDGTTHSHPNDGFRTHNDSDDPFLHTHADGATHSHPHDGPHTHDNDDPHMHTHENGTTHSHPHDGFHTHNDPDDPFLHTHSDGTTHSHPHDGPHTHDNDDPHMHTHEDGTTHSHPHDHPLGISHDHDHDMNDMHTHEHTHSDGTTHSHPHDHNMPDSHDHEHNHTHEHAHENGTTHNHPHDHTFTEDHDHEHTHEDGTTHSHPHDGGMEEENIAHTHINVLEKKNRAEDLGTHDLHILDLTPLNTTTVRIRLGVSDAVMQQILSSEDQHFLVLYSPDSLTWSEKEIPVSDIKVENFKEVVLYLSDLQPSTPYQFRVAFQEFVSSTSKARLMDSAPDADGGVPVDMDTSGMCFHNGSYYKPNQEFYQGCSHSCVCNENLDVDCIAIECPVTFGLELIDPDCYEWDLDPDYVPTPPKCCAQVKCKSTYACQYMGQTFNNYDEIPRELTGCSQVCTCNYGNVSCRSLCEDIPTIPPPHLDCPPQDAILMTLPGEPCCRSWQCPTHSVGKGLPEPLIMPLDARTVHISFSTPSHFQGLPGELLIRYTNDSSQEPDPSTWSQEVLIPMGSLISQSQWDHMLNDLMPDTDYIMQVVLTVQGAEPILSPLVSYTTMHEATTPPTTTPLPRLDIDAELYASEITKTSAKVSWRGFNDYELQYIDGVQVKYTEKDKLIPKFSQLFHRDNNQMDIRDLLPEHTYTVDLVFITHPNQTTQVTNTRPITFSTLPEEDPYEFEIEVRAGKVSSQTAELFYSGVPEPEEKYVNVYRAVYLREDERVDAQAFKIPKTGQDRKIFLDDLKPDVEYKVWLEAFLLNGRKKQSNVITITTRAGALPKPERSEVDPSARDAEGSKDYYPALVAVAIIAAIACVAFLGLLVILLRKQSQAKAHINSSRNNAAYDNPSYKVGDNAYDMEMNGLKSSGNGATHAEEP